METDTALDRVNVVGVGYIGYPLCLLLASHGYQVLAVDVDGEVVTDIRAGRPRTGEPDLLDLFIDPMVQRNLEASLVPRSAELHILSVPTPLRGTGRDADLAALENAALSIVPHVSPGNLVIVESTIPPGTTDGIVAPILAKSGLELGEELLLAHCPERLHPGSTLDELRNNDRILGGISTASDEAARAFYSTFVDGDLVTTDAVTAELCKLLENTYRDVNIALANQMAGLAEILGVDPHTALELASRHPRVDYLMPGIGVGGHCIPVDPWFLHQTAPDSASLIQAARKINTDRELIVAQRIEESLDGRRRGTIVVAGVAYKPNVSDTRESPSLAIAELLRHQDHEVRVFDPLVPGIFDSLLDAVRGADLLAITVPHADLVEEVAATRSPIEAAMRRPVILDFSSGSARPF